MSATTTTTSNVQSKAATQATSQYVFFFGGGHALYSGAKIIGGLGISGDTSCADHEISKRVRQLAGLNPPGGPLVDDITYTDPDGASALNEAQGPEQPA